MDFPALQQALRDLQLAGWLFYDFRGSDPLAASILGLEPGHQTRRWFYFVPAQGEAVKVVHTIESAVLDILPGKKQVYLAWQQLHQLLGETLAGGGRIAMQYSPHNGIPYVSRVDAGTVELIRSLGVEVVSSAELVQMFEARLTDAQWQAHQYAGDRLGELVQETFCEIARRLAVGTPTTEHDIQQFMMAGYQRAGLVTDHPPIVAAGPHTADPHYLPTETGSLAITAGSFVLIDTWAKRDQPGAVFADITWTGYVGRKIPAQIRQVFDIVRRARDQAVETIRQAQAAGVAIRGCDVDAACRAVISEAGFGDYFCHRTGHSIHTSAHGNGANLDNLETRDERRLIPRTCFSVEPGIYLPGKFGVRSEIDIFLPDAGSLVISGPQPQQEIVPIV